MASGAGGGGMGGASAIRAGAAYIELLLDDKKLTQGLGKWQAKLANAGASLLKIGGGMVGSGAAVAGGLFGAAIPELGDLAKINSAGKALGSTGEAMSGLFGALKSVGGDFKEDLEGIVQFMQKVQDAAAGKDGQAAALFEGLSVSAKDLAGVPLEEKFLRIHGAIRELPQEVQASKLSLMGGTDSMKKWLDVLSLSNDELRQRSASLRVDQADLNTATETNKAYQAATTAVGKAWTAVAVATAPAVQFLAEKFTALAVPVIDWIKENKAAFASAALIATGVAGAGAALVGLGAAFSVAAIAAGLIKSAFVGVGAVVAAVFSPAGLIIAGVAAAGYGLYWLATNTEKGQAALAALGEAVRPIGEYFRSTWSTITSAWAGIKDAFAAGDIGLAWKIGLAGLNVEWKRFSQLFVEGWIRTKLFFVEGWIEAVALFKTTFLELADGTLWARLLAAGAAAVFKLKGYFREVFREMKDQAVAAFEWLAAIAKAGPQEAGKMAGEWAAEKLMPVAEVVVAGEGLKKEFDDAAAEFGKGIAKQGKEGIRAAADTAKAEARAAAEVMRAQAQAGVDEARKNLAGLTDEALRKANAKIFAEFMNGDFNPSGPAKVPAAIKAVQDGSLGTFSTAALANRFGGTGDIPKRHLKATEITNAKLDTLIETVARIEGPKWT